MVVEEGGLGGCQSYTSEEMHMEDLDITKECKISLYRFYYPHMSRDSVSPLCGICFAISLISMFILLQKGFPKPFSQQVKAYTYLMLNCGLLNM